MAKRKAISAEIQRFLAGDLSKLKSRYDERFTRRLSFDGVSALDHDADDLDAAVREWATAHKLNDSFAHAVRSQPYEHAQRVFRDLTEMVREWDESKHDAGSLAQYAAEGDLDCVMAIFAVERLLHKKITLAWILETLCFFWPLDLVVQWLHTLFPDDFFPISAELLWRTDRFRRYCDGFEVDIEWPSTQDHPISAYWQVQDAILAWAEEQNMEPWQLWALFEHLAPSLFPDETGPLPQPRKVWIAMSSGESFDGLDDPEEPTQTWTANAKTRRGDIVLMYCMTPRKALTHRFLALCDAYENPFDDYFTSDRIWTELGEREVIPWITLDEMRSDPVLSTWGLVRSNFQGARKAIVPEQMWARIRNMTEEKSRDPHWPERVAIMTHDNAGAATSVAQVSIALEEQYQREREFEDRVVKPFLESLGIDLAKRVVQQVPIRMYVGSRRVTNRADFVIYTDNDRQAPSVVIEAKRSVQCDDELEAARQQAESYAGYVRVPRFVIVAPQGMWVYRLHFPGQSELLLNCPVDQRASDRQKRELQRALRLAR